MPMHLDILADTSQQNPEKRTVQIDRPVYTEDDLVQLYYNKEKKEKPSGFSNISKGLKTACTLTNIVAVILSLFPVISWLPQYQIKKDILRDISAGLTLGIIQIPQGMAYGMLTTLPAIYGLYASFVPVFVYFIFGSSKHLNMGTFAIVCLMVGEVVEKSVSPFTTLQRSINGTTVLLYDKEEILNLRVKYAVTVSFLVGIIQVAFGFLRFGFITIFLSDPLISGFTTGAAFHVFSSQVKYLVGMQIPRKEVGGVLGLFKLYFYIFKNVTQVNYGAFIIGVVSTVILFAVKYFAQRYKEKLKIPIPAELIIVVLGAGFSYAFHFNAKFKIPILKTIPTGMPPLTSPWFSRLDLIVDCLSIAIVSYVISVSIAKAFAKKNKYVIDANQELFAHGAVNIIGSFFSSTVASGSLSRSLIQENLGRTQLATLFACVLVLLTLTVLAPCFEPLPLAILASIVLVALKGLFTQFSVLKSLLKISKIDAFVWISSFIAVFCLGVDYGLAVGLVINLLSTVVRTSRPSTSSLGHVKKTEIYATITPDNEQSLEEIPGVKIFRFHSPLLYINVDHFQESLFKATVNPADCVTIPVPKCYQMSDEVKYDNSEDIFNMSLKEETCHSKDSRSSLGECSLRKRSFSQDSYNKVKCTLREIPLDASATPLCPLHTIILDCSQISYADTMGVGILVSVCSEFKIWNVDVHLCNTPDGLFKLLDLGGFIQMHGSENIFVSIHDAVQYSLAKEHLTGVCDPSMEMINVDLTYQAVLVEADKDLTSIAGDLVVA